MNETEKLKHLLEHWIEHNNAHTKTYLEWASKAELTGKKELAKILRQIASETKKQDELFKKALKTA
jgi:rubrerythrin